MREYQQFPISNFRTGFDEAVEPWLLPRDAYQLLINCHLYRGVLEKILGYQLYATVSRKEIYAMSPDPDGSTSTFTVTLAASPQTTTFFGYGQITGTTAEIFTYAGDASSTLLKLVGSSGGAGTIDLTTLVVTLNFNTPPPTSTFSSTKVFFIADYPTTPQAVMGIKPYYSNTGTQSVLVFLEKRIGLVVPVSGVVASLIGSNQGTTEIPFDYYISSVFVGTGAIATYFTSGFGANATPLQGTIYPGTVVFTQYTSAGVFVGTVTDNQKGGLFGIGVTSGTINYYTGDYTITFAANIANGNYFDATSGVFGQSYFPFHGGISNFFSLTNYQYKAFFTNNIDPIFYYDGISIHYLNTNLSVKSVASASGIPSYDISKCLHVTTNRERLLLVKPTVNGLLAQSTIYWSTAGDPLDFTNEELLQAPTSEGIVTINYVNTDLICRFDNSERVFRYTADAFSPFRWDVTNSIWACNAPFGTVNYDSWFSSVARTALLGSDGVNVKRADEVIPDFTQPYDLVDELPIPFMSQTSVIQCYGERFDDIKEGWICYNSNSLSEDVTASDNVLAFNYLDQTYAIYSFPFSCLGLGTVINAPTWATTYSIWSATSTTWSSYLTATNSLVDLAGDQLSKVYELNAGNSLGDNTSPVLMSAITKNFNPFIEEGQLCRFGYLDLFVTANFDTVLRVQFFINDQLYVDSSGNIAGWYQETVLTFNPTDAMSPNTNQTKVWKRIYVGSVGKEHTIRFYQNADDFDVTLNQPVYIHSFVLNMKPAGRIFS